MDQYSEDEVREALTPYHSRIRQVILDGFAEWLAVANCRSQKGFAPVLYPRTITNYVFDAIARNARTVFGADASVRVRDEAQTVKFCFGGVVIGRFKKGDDDHLGQNILTQAVIDFVDAQQTLPGLPPEVAKVEFIWAADELGTAIESVMVVARDGERMLWAYEIEDAAEGGIVIDFPAPSGPPEDDGQPLVAVKIKTTKENAEGE